MPQANLFSPFSSFQNSLGPVRRDPQLAAWETQRHGKYYASVYGIQAIVSPAAVAQAGPTWRGSNGLAGQATTVGLATTYTGLCLSNPPTAAGAVPINLAVRRVSIANIAAPGALISYGLIQGWAAGGITVHTTPITLTQAAAGAIVPCYIGAQPAGTTGSVLIGALLATLDAACTLVGTPSWDRWLGSNNASGNLFSGTFDLDDDTLIPPGGYLAVGSNIAGPASAMTFMWEQINQ